MHSPSLYKHIYARFRDDSINYEQKYINKIEREMK